MTSRHLLNALDAETAARVLDDILDALRELSDPEWQRTAWFGEVPGVQASYVEAACSLFDDSALGKAIDGKGCVFGEEIDSQFIQLRLLMDGIDSYPTKMTLESDEWRELVQQAALVHGMMCRAFARE